MVILREVSDGDVAAMTYEARSGAERLGQVRFGLSGETMTVEEGEGADDQILDGLVRAGLSAGRGRGMRRFALGEALGGKEREQLRGLGYPEKGDLERFFAGCCAGGCTGDCGACTVDKGDGVGV